MPMRKQLRSHGRVDIEKAISRYGGFRKTAILLNLSLAYKHRKPKGYWDNLENLQEEVIWTLNLPTHIYCKQWKFPHICSIHADQQVSEKMGNGSCIHAKQEIIRTCRLLLNTLTIIWITKARSGFRLLILSYQQDDTTLLEHWKNGVVCRRFLAFYHWSWDIPEDDQTLKNQASLLILQPVMILMLKARCQVSL